MDILKEKTKEGTQIKNIIAVMSGKGGVGKSSVSSLVALALKKEGYNVGILDADITGPSIPKVFGVNYERAMSDGETIYPIETNKGIKVMSLNLLIDNEEDPVVWRSPLITGAVKQFYTDVAWGELDYLVIDMPPGTGDVSLTIMQSLPVDGLLIVSSPQDLVKLIVKKSIKMAKMMDTKVYGLIENMSYFKCDDCQTRHYIFGESKLDDVAKEMDLDVISRLPLYPKFVEKCDQGEIENFGDTHESFINDFASKLMPYIK